MFMGAVAHSSASGLKTFSVARDRDVFANDDQSFERKTQMAFTMWWCFPFPCQRKAWHTHYPGLTLETLLTTVLTLFLKWLWGFQGSSSRRTSSAGHFHTVLSFSISSQKLEWTTLVSTRGQACSGVTWIMEQGTSLASLKWERSSLVVAGEGRPCPEHVGGAPPALHESDGRDQRQIKTLKLGFSFFACVRVRLDVVSLNREAQWALPHLLLSLSSIYWQSEMSSSPNMLCGLEMMRELECIGKDDVAVFSPLNYTHACLESYTRKQKG